MYSTSEKAKRLEFRTPDPSCNPYFGFPAMLMAGLDGIRNKIDPPKPIDKNLYELEPEEAAKVKSMPGSKPWMPSKKTTSFYSEGMCLPRT
jgi:glutamine synthetase